MDLDRLRARLKANPATAALVAAAVVLLALIALPAGPWTLLEVLKLAASLALPVALLFIGLKLERRKVANQELVRKRVAVYDYVAFRLNDILCFFGAFGDWAKMNPDTVIAAKREADRHMHVYRALFSDPLFAAYEAFMDSCFQTFADPAGGSPAKLRLDVGYARINMGRLFDETWMTRIATEDERKPVAVHRAAYVSLMREFAREIGVDD